MKGLTKLSIFLSALTVVIGYTGLILNVFNLRKTKKIEKALEK